MARTWQDQILEELPDPVLVLDTSFVLLYANKAASRLLGYDEGVWLGRVPLSLLHPDDFTLLMHRTSSVAAVPTTVRVADNFGEWHHWELLATRQMYGDVIGGYIVVARELAQRHSLEIAGDDSSLLRALVNHTSAMLAVVEIGGIVRSINGTFVRELGLDPTKVVGRSYLEWIVPTDRDRVQSIVAELEVRPAVTFDAGMLKDSGDEILVELTVTDFTSDPAVKAFIVSGQIATSLKAARQQAQFLESHDRLTGLLNRPGFFQSAALLERQARRDNELVGVIAFDIDRLGAINELYGREAGDAVIMCVAQRIQQSVRQSDLVCRFDGDRFAVAASGSLDSILSIKQRAAAAITEDIVIGDKTLRVTASTTVACRADERRIDVLIEEADLALVDVARGGRPAGGSGTGGHSEKRRLVEELQTAVEHDQLQPWFQPIVDVAGVTVGFESLLRWLHPERGVLLPGYFMPLVALAGMADHVGETVITKSLAFARHLADESERAMVVHVNITPGQLGQSGFAAEVRRHYESAGVSPDRLCLEITESDLLGISTTATENLDGLRSHGVHIAIDDFGTGYSSLAHLLELPVDMLKIDRRFVDGLGRDAMATSLTTAILGLTASVGLECVAEGVETRRQRNHLVGLGCTRMQGWLYDRALPPGEAIGRVTRADNAQLTGN